MFRIRQQTLQDQLELILMNIEVRRKVYTGLLLIEALPGLGFSS